MKKETKLILKGLTDNGVPFTKEIRTLDEVKSCGNFIVVCKNASVSNGLPQIDGKSHSCFCCEMQLKVTCCYPEDESQSNTAYGQTLTICDRETGTTNSYIRTFAPGKNKGKWSAWLMIATGNIKIISDNNNINETLSNLSDKVDEEIERATAREDSIVQNLINELTSIKNNAEKNLLDTEKKIFDNVNIQQQTASSKYNHLWKNIVFKDNYFINLNGTFTYSNSQLVKATEEYYTCNNSEMLNIFLWLKPSYDIFVAFYMPKWAILLPPSSRP